MLFTVCKKHLAPLLQQHQHASQYPSSMQSLATLSRAVPAANIHMCYLPAVVLLMRCCLQDPKATKPEDWDEILYLFLQPPFTYTCNVLHFPLYRPMRCCLQDPKATKPEDWDEREKITDPEDKKPEGWDDIPATSVDPDAKKPEDWSDEDDGEWEAPTIPNPEYKGEWKPKM
jgi:hypothetical protein